MSKKAPKQTQQIQQMRFSEKEKELLAITFKNREDLLIALRNFFFNLADEGQISLVRSHIKTTEIKKLMRKVVIPELAPDIPIGQTVDLWMTVNIDQGWVYLKARELLIKALNEALELLDDPKAKKVDLNVPSEMDRTEFEPHLIARNMFITHMEMRMLEIRTLANAVQLSPEELQKRIKQDSLE
jgi:hypothetical protein